ncbi:hypothetical protein CapIbe_012730 [Capra ibex]
MALPPPCLTSDGQDWQIDAFSIKGQPKTWPTNRSRMATEGCSSALSPLEPPLEGSWSVGKKSNYTPEGKEPGDLVSVGARSGSCLRSLSGILLHTEVGKSSAAPLEILFPLPHDINAGEPSPCPCPPGSSLSISAA